MTTNLKEIQVKTSSHRFWATVSRVWSDQNDTVAYLDKVDEDLPIPVGAPVPISEPSNNINTILTAAMINRSLVEVFLENGFIKGVIGYHEKV
ncbi:MAG: hypothetical protein AB7V56_12550 [Candidatus Nitrosocosmicus sp.]